MEKNCQIVSNLWIADFIITIFEIVFQDKKFNDFIKEICQFLLENLTVYTGKSAKIGKNSKGVDFGGGENRKNCQIVFNLWIADFIYNFRNCFSSPETFTILYGNLPIFTGKFSCFLQVNLIIFLQKLSYFIVKTVNFPIKIQIF